MFDLLELEEVDQGLKDLEARVVAARRAMARAEEIRGAARQLRSHAKELVAESILTCVRQTRA